MNTLRIMKVQPTALLALAFAGLPWSDLTAEPSSDIGTLDDSTAKQAWGEKTYSPYVGRAYPTRVFWGDTHLHTALSSDATVFGNTLELEAAYRFARGEELRASSGQKVKLSRPLDFLVVADHAEGLGTMVELFKGNAQLLKDPTLKKWYELFNSGPDGGMKAYTELNAASAAGEVPAGMSDRTLARTIWDDYVKAADKYNDPGRFTALIGYERDCSLY